MATTYTSPFGAGFGPLTGWNRMGQVPIPYKAPSVITLTTSGGVRTLTPAKFGTTDSILLAPMFVLGLQKVRGNIYYVGGSAPGTLAVTVSAAISVKHGA